MNLTQNLLKSHLLLSVTSKGVRYECWSQLRPLIPWNKDIILKPTCSKHKNDCSLQLTILNNALLGFWRRLGSYCAVLLQPLCECLNPEQSPLLCFPEPLGELRRDYPSTFNWLPKWFCYWFQDVSKLSRLIVFISLYFNGEKVGNPLANKSALNSVCFLALSFFCSFSLLFLGYIHASLSLGKL